MAHGPLISGFAAAIAKESYTGGLPFGTTTKPVTAERLEIVDFFGQDAEGGKPSSKYLATIPPTSPQPILSALARDDHEKK